jgi:adenosylcobinamide kinase / adenosylcobinamide-phosphate guanylyltransferase
LQLAQAIEQHSQANTLVVVDCLTLWLTNCLMPMLPNHDSSGEGQDTEVTKKNKALAQVGLAQCAPLLVAIVNAPGPVVLVGNEIGLGVIPMGAEVRAFVDALGRLNQDVAATCQRVTLMAAGLPLTLKDMP